MLWKFPKYEIGNPIDWDFIESNYDWFSEMRNVPQDQEWHAEGDVMTHTKMVVEALVNLPEYIALNEQDKHILFASALLHDVEKRSTTIIEEIDGIQRISSPKHALKGEYTTRKILYTDITTPFEIREQIAKLVRHHGLPLWAIQRSDSNKAVIGASLVVNTKHLSILAKADVLGRICKDPEDLLLKIEFFNELCIENQCFGNKREFKTNYGRYWYLSREDSFPDYIPFEDLKFDVYMMCALPGTGKDTYIKKHFKLPVVSLDDLRRAHKIDPTDSKKNGQVIQLGKERAKELMRVKQSFVFNATNITADIRNRWISLFTSYGARVKIVYLEVPYKQLLAQNHNRTFKVPENVLKMMIKKLEIPNFSEAHEVIFEVSS